MLRNATGILAMVLVLGSSGLSTSAFAGGGSYGVGGEDNAFRANQFGSGFAATPADGHGGYGSHANSSRRAFRGYEGRDVWGHWGAYYGPMVPMI
jgi:hypothetical protein